MPEREHLDALLSDFDDERMLTIGLQLARFLALQNPDVGLYLVADGEGALLSGPAMAGEIAAQTELGSSFVDLFVAGAVRSESREDRSNFAPGLEQSLAAIDSAIEGLR